MCRPRHFCINQKGLVFTVLKKLVCFLFVILMLTATLPVVSAADNTATATVEQMIAKTKDLSFSGTLMDIKYRRYNSLSYTPEEDNIKSTLVVYFHDQGAEGDDNKAQLQADSILSHIMSADMEAACKDYNYIVIAPQCPKGQSFTGTTGKDYKFTPNASAVMSTVKELVDEISMTNVVFEDRIVVMGTGTGATAAYDFFCRYPTYVTRVMSVGGYCDANAVAVAERAKGKAFRVVAPKGDSAALENARTLKSKMDSADFVANFEYYEYDGNTANALKQALAFNEPYITQWAVAENYASGGFTFSCNASEGGTVSPKVANVGFNGAVMINITQNEGYKISSVKVNNQSIPLDALKQGANPNVYTYNVLNIKQDTVVEVDFSIATTMGGKYDTVIDRTIKWCLWLSGAFLVLGAVAYFLFWYEKSLKSAKK